MLQVAFVLLCLAQIVHYSRHLYALDLRLREEARTTRLRNAVDWTVEPRRRRRGNESVIDRFADLFSFKK